MASQQDNVTLAIPQGRHQDVQNVEPIKQVLPKTPDVNGLRQVRIARGDDPDIGPARFGRTQGPVFAVFQKTQQLDLGREEQRVDFVQEESATLGSFDQTAGRSRSAGIGPGA
jgi:hypothetical protein